MYHLGVLQILSKNYNNNNRGKSLILYDLLKMIIYLKKIINFIKCLNLYPIKTLIPTMIFRI